MALKVSFCALPLGNWGLGFWLRVAPTASLGLIGEELKQMELDLTGDGLEGGEAQWLEESPQLAFLRGWLIWLAPSHPTFGRGSEDSSVIQKFGRA